MEHSESHSTFTWPPSSMSCPATYISSGPHSTPQLWKKNKTFEPVSPGSSSKYYPLSSFLLPLHFSKEKSVLAASRSSPHIHSLSHSHLASGSAPSLKLPSPSYQWPSNPVSGLTLLVLSSSKHSPPSTNSSHSWLPRWYFLLPLCSSSDACPNFSGYTY